jgi:glycosyltransferase involved in cell wall biosynthesis
MNVHIVFVTTVPHTLGFLDGQVRFLKKRGWKIGAISSPAKELVDFGRQLEIQVFPVDMRRRFSPLGDIRAIWQMHGYLRRIRPNIVSALTPKAGLLAMICAVFTRTPIRIYHMLGLRYSTFKGVQRAFLWGCEWLTCHLAHRVICVGPSLYRYALSERVSPEKKIMVIHSGSISGVDAVCYFNPARFPEDARDVTRRQYDIPPGANVIGFVGRIVNDKGIKELIEAWELLRDRMIAVHLMIVGRIEDEDPIPRNILDIIRASPEIHQTGYVPDISLLYRAMDILVLPTYREGFPNTPLEGSAMELPVIVTRVVGCVDAVQEDLTGLIVPPKDSRALAEAIERYVHDPALRIKHGRAGRERVLMNFQPEPIWQAIFYEYQGLLFDKNQGRGN